MSLSKPSVYTAIWLRWQNKKVSHAGFPRCHLPLQSFPRLLLKHVIPVFTKHSANITNALYLLSVSTSQTCVSAHRIAKDIPAHQHHESPCHHWLTLLPRKRSLSSWKNATVPTINVQTCVWPCWLDRAHLSAQRFAVTLQAVASYHKKSSVCSPKVKYIWTRRWGHPSPPSSPWAC